MEEEDKSLEQAKEVAYYGALVTAWVQSRMEADKTLLAIASAGIGLLVTLASAFGPGSAFGKACLALAVGAFVTVILGVVYIFDRNPKHIEEVVTRDQTRDGVLDAVDRAVRIAFLVGIAGSLCVGYDLATHVPTGGTSMSDKTRNETAPGGVDTTGGGAPEVLERSLSGIQALRPGAQQPDAAAPAPAGETAPSAPSTPEPAPADQGGAED
jgi:hypothetical protein